MDLNRQGKATYDVLSNFDLLLVLLRAISVTAVNLDVKHDE